MKILIVANSSEGYLAKNAEAWRNGLRAHFDVRSFGEGYPGYDPSLKSYPEIVERMFPDGGPDLLIAEYYYFRDGNLLSFTYSGIEEVQALKGIHLTDYWYVTDEHLGEFERQLRKFDITCVLTMCLRPKRLYADPDTQRRFIFAPACFDPQETNDWGLPKQFDVGFLGAGTTTYDSFYPERHLLHLELMKQTDLKYLYANHPGYDQPEHPHVKGSGFSQAINSCRAFIVTASPRKVPFAKYIEAMASGALLIGTPPEEEPELQLVDGVNWVRAETEAEIIPKLRWHLERPEVLERIARNGYKTAMERHTCYRRAVDIYSQIHEAGLLPRRESAAHVPLEELESKQLYRSALQLFEAGKLDEAISALEDVIAVDPNHADALNDLGALYYEKGELALALNHLTQACTIRPEDSNAQANLQQVRHALEND